MGLDELTAKEQEEYKRLTGLEKLGSLMGKELPERSQKRLNEYRKRLGENMVFSEDETENIREGSESPKNTREVLKELRNYREKWEKNIDLYTGIKNRIINVAKNIPVKVGRYADRSRLIEFKLPNQKRYKILYPQLENNTDDEYRMHVQHTSIKKIDEDYVRLGGMRGDDVDGWENERLKEYVKEKEKEGLHIPKIEEMRKLLGELGKLAGLDEESDQIAMLMYLTGMDGGYWLSMRNSKKSGSQDSRLRLVCFSNGRGFNNNYDDNTNANLCLMSR